MELAKQSDSGAAPAAAGSADSICAAVHHGLSTVLELAAQFAHVESRHALLINSLKGGSSALSAAKKLSKDLEAGKKPTVSGGQKLQSAVKLVPKWLTSVREYDEKLYPEFLGFELSTTFTLYPIQAEKMQDMIGKRIITTSGGRGVQDHRFQDKQWQLAMGIGKTKTIAVILAIIMSVPNRYIYIFVAPEFLFGPNTNDLAGALADWSGSDRGGGKKVTQFLFARELVSVEFLQNLLLKVITALASGQLWTARTRDLHTLEGMYYVNLEGMYQCVVAIKEAHRLLRAPTTNDFEKNRQKTTIEEKLEIIAKEQAELNYIRKIYSLVSAFGIYLIDELDTNFDTSNVVNLPVDKLQPSDPEDDSKSPYKSGIAKRSAVQLTRLFFYLATGSFEFTDFVKGVISVKKNSVFVGQAAGSGDASSPAASSSPRFLLMQEQGWRRRTRKETTSDTTYLITSRPVLVCPSNEVLLCRCGRRLR